MKTAKTILLSIIMLGLIVPAFAQQTAKNYSNLPAGVKVFPGYQEAVKLLKGDLKPVQLPDDLKFKGKDFDSKYMIPTQKTTGKNIDQPLANPSGVLLGTAWYDWKARGNMPRQITTFSYSATEHYFNVATLGSAEGTAGKADFVSFGGNQPTYASLGTYYQFVDFSGDEPTSTLQPKRIEKYPSYAGSVGQFSDGKALSVSFPFPLQLTPPRYSKNDDVGTDVFATDTMPNTTTFFPRAVVDGNDNVHALVGHRVTGEDNFNEVGYIKGANAGANWGSEIIMTGPNAGVGASPYNAGIETYVIDAEGQEVVFAYVDKNLNFLFRKSHDGGNTWGGLNLIWRAEYDTVYTKKDPSGTFYGWTDSAICPGLVMDAMIDANGDYHFVVNAMITSHQGEVVKNSNNQWEFVAGTDSAKYVNLYYPKIGFIYVFVPKDTTLQGTLTMAGPPSDGEFNSQQGNYVPYYYTTAFLNDSTPGAFCVADANLGYDPDGNVYLTYSSVRDSMNANSQPDAKALIHSQSGQSYSFYNRHVFATKYDKIAKSWSKPVSLSPNGWDCSFPSMAKKLIKKKGETRLPVVYLADQDPTCFITFNSMFTMTSEPKSYMYPFKAQDYSAGLAVEDNIPTNASISIVPNPIDEYGVIYYSSSVAGSIKVELFNMLGQKVMDIFNGVSMGGTQSFEVNSSALNSGTYVCKITNGNRTATQTLVISK